MTLNEIISQVDWNEVAVAIVSERPYQRPVLEGFKKVFESLLLMEPAGSEYRIRIDRTPDVLDPEDTYPEVVGIKEGVDERWALSFCPWTEWLGMEVCQATLEAFSVSQIVANCLHEMTFFGFTEEKIKGHRDELDDRIREAEEHPEKLIKFNPNDYRFEITTKGYLRCLDRWLRWGAISKEYFGEDDAWFKDRFLRKKAPEYFDELDRQTLKAALKEVAREILDVAKEM